MRPRGMKTKKKITPSTTGLIIFPKSRLKRIQNLFKENSKSDLNNVTVNKTTLSNAMKIATEIEPCIK